MHASKCGVACAHILACAQCEVADEAEHVLFWGAAGAPPISPHSEVSTGQEGGAVGGMEVGGKVRD